MAEPTQNEVAALALRDWLREEFEPRDSIWYDEDGHQTVEVGGWDHEHCLICRTTISAKGDDQHVGYSDEDDHWLCETCYGRYIEPHLLGRPSHASEDGREEAG